MQRISINIEIAIAFAIAIISITINLYFLLPKTLEIILTTGGSFGIGLLLLPLTLTANAFLFPGFMAFSKTYRKSKTILIANLGGILYCLILIDFFKLT